MDFSSIKDVLTMYTEFQRAHPHIGTMVASEVTYLLGDAFSQLTLEKRLNYKKLGYTAALAPFYGVVLEGLLESGELVGRHISDNPFAKSALGPNLWGNLFNVFFFYNNTIGEESGYSLKSLAKGYASLVSPSAIRENGFIGNIRKKMLSKVPGHEYKKSVIGAVTGWNAVQTLNYYFVPAYLRMSTSMAVGTAWLTALTAWSTIGARKKIKEK
jgi:hypothetical protein